MLEPSRAHQPLHWWGKIPQTFEWQNFEVSLAIVVEFFHRILTVLFDFNSKS
jgi:hypothetical protein